jgi:hypothetical protein
MIVVRDVFKLKFGKARDALAAWKEMGAYIQRSGSKMGSPRILTDLVGEYYTMVMETSWDNLSAWENEMQRSMGEPEWRTLYQKFTPLIESGYREILTVQNI